MNRRAFTLIELIITIAIIGILAALGLAALSSATESAKRQRTESTIAKINAVIMRRWSELQTRRMPIEFHPEKLPPNDVSTPARTAAIKLNALRQLMLYEFPNTITEIMSAPKYADLYQGDPQRVGYALMRAPFFRESPPPGMTAYQSKVAPLLASKTVADLDTDFGPAECLYLIVISNADDAAQFRSDEAGDKDNDGLKEFKDGWDFPITWIRWPVGLVSDMQPLYDSSTPPKATLDPSGSRVMTDASGVTMAVDHDPFDVRQIDQTAFRTVPLIASSGGQPNYGIRDKLGAGVTFTYKKLTFPAKPAPFDIYLLDIFRWDPDTKTYGNDLGADDASTGAKASALITNHDQGRR